MIKKMLFLILLSMSSQFIQSQSVRFSIFADPKLSWFTTSTNKISNKGVRAGARYGFTMDRFFTDNYAFTTGLSINHINGRLSFQDTSILNTSDGEQEIPPETPVLYKMQYVTVPLGLKFVTNDIGYMRFYADIGFTGEIAIRSEGKIKELEINNTNIKDEMNPFNLSYYMGLGIEYSLGGSSAIMAGFMYNNGILDITSDDQLITSSNLALRVGLIF